jgi:hypothetical protein
MRFPVSVAAIFGVTALETLLLVQILVKEFIKSLNTINIIIINNNNISFVMLPLHAPAVLRT